MRTISHAALTNASCLDIHSLDMAAAFHASSAMRTKGASHRGWGPGRACRYRCRFCGPSRNEVDCNVDQYCVSNASRLHGNTALLTSKALHLVGTLSNSICRRTLVQVASLGHSERFVFEKMSAPNARSDCFTNAKRRRSAKVATMTALHCVADAPGLPNISLSPYLKGFGRSAPHLPQETQHGIFP